MAVDEVCIAIHKDEDIITARSKGRDMAKELGFGAVDQSRIPTAISELARNILVYAGSGVIRIRPINMGARKGLEVVAEDTGPGIENIEMALSDGYSSVGSLGLGLPGAKRLMDEMEVHSKIGEGTTVVARKWTR
jgi:serine/threonine-protein kinase RsbT